MDDMREMLKRRKAAILGELSELGEKRTAIMEAHARATELHIRQMTKIQDRMKVLHDQAEHVAAQWEHEFGKSTDQDQLVQES